MRSTRNPPHPRECSRVLVIKGLHGVRGPEGLRSGEEHKLLLNALRDKRRGLCKPLHVKREHRREAQAHGTIQVGLLDGDARNEPAEDAA